MNRAPLAGIRVCDITQNLAGPFCCQILGDLGAEIIKVEPPGGDPARLWGPPFWGDDATLFLSVNRNKKSVLLDVRTPRGREALHRIARTCDIFVQSSRIGVPERRGYDYESIRAVRPDIVHMSITAYGDQGPLREAPGYDPLMQAFAGIMSVTGHRGEAPARVGGSVVDYGTGMWAAIAILAALRDRDRSGQGARLTTALLDTSLNWIAYHIMGYLATGRVPGPMGTGLESIVPYEAFPTADGHVMIAAGSDAIFVRLVTALGLHELAADPRFRTNPDRVANRTELVPRLFTVTRTLTTEALMETLMRSAVPASPIRNVAEVVIDPQVVASDMVVQREDPTRPGYQDISIPFRMDGLRPRGGELPPHSGEHTAEILKQVGLGEEEIEFLLAASAAGGQPSE